MKLSALLDIFCISLTTLAQAVPEVVLQNVSNLGFKLAAASLDGRRLVTLGSGKLMLWNVASGLQVRS